MSSKNDEIGLEKYLKRTINFGHKKFRTFLISEKNLSEIKNVLNDNNVSHKNDFLKIQIEICPPKCVQILQHSLEDDLK